MRRRWTREPRTKVRQGFVFDGSGAGETLDIKQLTLGRSPLQENTVKMRGFSAGEASKRIQRSTILIDNGIAPTTIIQAWQAVEGLTRKQLEDLKNRGPAGKKFNTSFRIHVLDRHLEGHLTADLPVLVGNPGRFRLLFHMAKNKIKCLGIIDDHHDAKPLVGGHTMLVNGKIWHGVLIRRVLDTG